MSFYGLLKDSRVIEPTQHEPHQSGLMLIVPEHIRRVLFWETDLKKVNVSSLKILDENPG